jgi:polyribonucleotide nucleotidyltransferase
MRLSMRALKEKPEGYVEPERRPRPSGDRKPGDRKPGDRRPGGDRDDRRGPKNDRGRGGDRRDGSERRQDGPKKRFGQKADAAPAPQLDDYREPVEEIF